MDHVNFVPVTDCSIPACTSTQLLSTSSRQSSTIDTVAEDSLTFSSPLDSPYLVPRPYSTELSARSTYTASPPIGRTTTSALLPYSPCRSTSSPITPGHSASSRPRADSGFCSWVGTAESQQKFFPVLMRIDSEDQQPLQPDSDRFDIDFPIPSPRMPLTNVVNSNNCSVTRPHINATNNGPDLSALPCANALNEELTDRMLARGFGDTFLGTSTRCAIEPGDSREQNANAAVRPKERFKLTSSILINAEKTDSAPSGLTTCCVGSSVSRADIHSMQNFVLPMERCTIDNCPHCTAVHHRRPDSTPIHGSSGSRARSRTNFVHDRWTIDAGHDGDDETEALPSSDRRHSEKRVRRNTHRVSQAVGGRIYPPRSTRTVSRSSLDARDVPSHRQTTSPNTRLSQGTLHSISGAHGELGLSNGDPLSPLRTPSIPDVVPRQLYPLPVNPALSPRSSVTFYHSPLFKLSPLTRQRSFSFPLRSTTPRPIPLGQGYVVDQHALPDGLDHDAVCSLSASERLSFLAHRMAQIGDELDADYRLASLTFRPYRSFHGPTGQSSGTLSTLFAITSSFTSALAFSLDCVFSLLEHVRSTSTPPTLSAQLPNRSVRRRRTATYAGGIPINQYPRRYLTDASVDPTPGCIEDPMTVPAASSTSNHRHARLHRRSHTSFSQHLGELSPP